MSKGKALMAFAFNVKQLTKLSEFIKASIEQFKADLQEVQDAVNELKTNYPTFKEYGETLNTEGITESPQCFRKIYGPIKYTSA